MGNRVAMGLDVFGKQTNGLNYLSYNTQTLGGAIRFGLPLTDNLNMQTRYSGYSQKITLPDPLNNCMSGTTPLFSPTPAGYNPHAPGAVRPLDECYYDGEASLAVRKELSQGTVFVSLVGWGLSYNTLDNNRSPTSGISMAFNQDIAGVGGDVNFVKSTADFKHYAEIGPDIVGMTNLRAGYATGWGGQSLRMLDHFQASPNLVRGFAPSGFGPRDLTPGTNQDALGGSYYWAATYELQTPIFFAPKDFSMRFALFADAGQLLDYRGPTSWAVTGEQLVMSADNPIRSSVGAGLLWDSPIGPLRFDFAIATTKASYDKTQFFRFGGGTKF
jgi:outer membrane protein insertion porin family